MDIALLCVDRPLGADDTVEGLYFSYRSLIRVLVLIFATQAKTEETKDLSKTALANARSKLKLGLLSYPVLQTADVLLYE